MALNEAGNPARCRCCFDCGDCMPLVYTNVSCPYVTSTTSCRTTALESWATPTYTAKIPPGASSGYYATEVGGGATGCNCSWQLVQYCKDDTTGTRERAWVVEGWCHDNDTNATTHYGPVVVTDWVCYCEGARYPFDLGFGGCCCECPAVDNCCCDNVPTTLTASDGSNSVDLVYDSGTGCWSGFAASFIGCTEKTVTLCCQDVGGGSCFWDMSLSPAGGVDQPANTGSFCDPFELTFSAGGCDAGAWVITVTP